MNNNQDMNVNQQTNNFINNQTYPQNNEVNNNQMPYNNINEQNLMKNNNQTINPFINNDNINNPVNKGYVEMLREEGINIQDQSRFISDNNFNETSINALNIEEDYNNLNKPDYSNDPKVMENLGRIQKKEKVTVSITKELKLMIIISLGLLIFVLFLPTLFNFFRDINN